MNELIKKLIIFQRLLSYWLVISLIVSLILWAVNDGISYGKIFFTLYFSPIIIYLVAKVFIAFILMIIDLLKQKFKKEKNGEITFNK
ncbi:MAG: hypothetical protein Q7T79_01555 [bacterium]|nr:hypothetical protein [bacterium]